MSQKPFESVPSQQGEISAIASAHAPFVYFDNASALGHLNGIIQITLEANRLLPLDGGAAGSDRVVVAHLRMNITAARGLYAALEKALLLAAPAQSDAKN